MNVDKTRICTRLAISVIFNQVQLTPKQPPTDIVKMRFEGKPEVESFRHLSRTGQLFLSSLSQSTVTQIHKQQPNCFLRSLNTELHRQNVFEKTLSFV
jgi:heme oxygenase